MIHRYLLRCLPFIAVLAISATLACSTPIRGSNPTSASNRPSSLTEKAAILRAQQINDVSYTLWFGLDATNKEFAGRATLQFILKEKAKNLDNQLVLDFEGGEIQQLVINGQKLAHRSTNRFDGHHIFIQTNELQEGTNRIEVTFLHPYSTNGNGLHRFQDPADNQIYLYSNFEPYNTHRMFPCFDQPDLKATYEVVVEAPEDWQVISNTLETEVTLLDHRKTWEFPRSRKFSTYVFALHAGPYASWKSNADGIPIRLFSRKSISSYVNPNDWLKVTRQGLNFFQKFFDYPYPFDKYDQILVPDFNSGAMENVGAVTFSESFAPRTRVTQDLYRGRAKTILHEMAHMWFGDLVTLKWWNGLWLNESFATVMSAWALDEATSFGGSWLSFLTHEKQGAYFEDQLVTTHPIEMPIPNTEAAESNFDGITYGKGASVLKQLSYFLGPSLFKKGLQNYFKKYEFGNTQLEDFVTELSASSGRDLSSWQKLWLQTSGVNRIRADWKCEKNPKTGATQISAFQLLQDTSRESSHALNPLRPHRTQVAFFSLPKAHPNKGVFHLTSKLETTYFDSKTEIPAALGKPCPDVVYPNFEDYDYAKVELDPVSLDQITRHLAKLPTPLDRQLIWHSLWEMVLDGKLKAQTYADIVLTQSPGESNIQVLSEVLGKLAQPSAARLSVLKLLPSQLRTRYQDKIQTFAQANLIKAQAGTDLQLVWYHAFLSSVSSQNSQKFLADLLDGTRHLKGLKVDQERRWQILIVLARNGFKSHLELVGMIQKELEKDLTDMGEKKAIAAQASIPDPETKNQWLARITRSTPSHLKEKPLPLAKLREAMWNYQLLNQENNIRFSVNSYFETLQKLARSSSIEDIDYAGWFSRGMFPSLCDASIVERTTDLIQKNPNLPASVMKTLKIHRQVEEQCIRARKFSERF